ncbi:MAG: hypothetical protein MJ124_05815 [Lachnospiraceae bacterium]|nr:hypothetical protein [Lachnospiraceae bacterium]
MNAEPLIMQMKYADIVEEIAWQAGISYDDAMKAFYDSGTFLLIHNGISDMHCRSVGYLAEDIIAETDRSQFERYILIEEFLKTTDIKKNTIEKNHRSIKKVLKIRNQYMILEGARYPYRIKSMHVKNAEDARYYTLKAMNEFRYIDNEILGISQCSFDFIVEEFLAKGLIKKNKSNNAYGLNGYDITGEGMAVICEKKHQTIKKMAAILGTYSGAFAGQMQS